MFPHNPLSSALLGASWLQIIIRSIFAKGTGYSFYMWVSLLLRKSGMSKFFVKFSISLILLLELVVVSAEDAEVYKWVDDEGNIHFGDCPPTSCESEKIDIAPAPSNQQVEDAQDRFRHLQEYQKKLRESREAERDQKTSPVTSSPPDAECFSSLSDAWGGEIPDSREAVQRRPLANATLRRFEKFFQAVKGHWRGNMVDTRCINPQATPPTELYRYDLSLDALWKSDRLFRIEAELDSDDPESDLRHQFFWFLLSRDGLRYSEANSEIIFELDRPRYDVEDLVSDKNSIMFFMRRGGILRRTNVFSLHRAGRSFTIREFFYVQGILAEKRFWTIDMPTH